jgi:aspartate 1-decarboxylase
LVGCSETVQTNDEVITVDEYKKQQEDEFEKCKNNLLNFAKENSINDAIVLLDFEYGYSWDIKMAFKKR